MQTLVKLRISTALLSYCLSFAACLRDITGDLDWSGSVEYVLRMRFCLKLNVFDAVCNVEVWRLSYAFHYPSHYRSNATMTNTTELCSFVYHLSSQNFFQLCWLANSDRKEFMLLYCLLMFIHEQLSISLSPTKSWDQALETFRQRLLSNFICLLLGILIPKRSSLC